MDHFRSGFECLDKILCFSRIFFNLSTSLTRDYNTFLVLQHGTTVCLQGQWTTWPTSELGVSTRHDLSHECFFASRLFSGRRLGPADVHPGGPVGTCHLSTGPAVSNFFACHGIEQGPCWGSSCAPTSRWAVWYLPAPHGTYQEGLYAVGPAACHCSAPSRTGDSTYSPSTTVPALRGTGYDS